MAESRVESAFGPFVIHYWRVRDPPLRWLARMLRLTAARAVHGFVGFPLGFLLALCFAAVVELLALGHGELAFGNAIAEINLQGNDGHSLLLRLDLQLLDFAAIQKQLALSQRIVIARAAWLIFGNVAVDEPRLAAANFRVGLAKRSLSFPQ